MSLAKGTRVRVREDFDWSYDPGLYVIEMEDFGGKYGFVRNYDKYDGLVELDLDDEDNSPNWTFHLADLEIVTQCEAPYCVGDMVRVIPGFIEREIQNVHGERLYVSTMRRLEGNEYKVLSFDFWHLKREAEIEECDERGRHITNWTFYIEDLEPAVQETFSADQSLDSILSDNFICF